MIDTVNKARVLLTSKDVARMMSICRRSLWRLVQRNEFPQPIRLSRKAVFWHRRTVEAFLDSLADRAAGK